MFFSKDHLLTFEIFDLRENFLSLRDLSLDAKSFSTGHEDGDLFVDLSIRGLEMGRSFSLCGRRGKEIVLLLVKLFCDLFLFLCCCNSFVAFNHNSFQLFHQIVVVVIRVFSCYLGFKPFDHFQSLFL